MKTYFEITCMPDAPEFQEGMNMKLNEMLSALDEAGKIYHKDLVARWNERCDAIVSTLRNEFDEGIWNRDMFAKKCVSTYIEEAYALLDLYGQH